MEGKKYVVFLELKGQGLTQIGYLKLGVNEPVKKGSCIATPFKLTDKCFADRFDSAPGAVVAIKKVVDSLNWGYYSSFKRIVEEVKV